jgi:8-oxo-dGTP pyrophosphatase MutT (NUDIX family)
MSAGDSRLTTGQAAQSFPQSLRPSQLRRLRECAQVAAVCYRIVSSSVDFLLVRTRSGRWTFPKGGVEPGLTHAQTAALEAFEEAGVHGRIEEVSFTRYIRRKGDRARRSEKGSEGEIAVSAHLCEVLRLSPPQESKRHPTWFSAEKAKQRLREDRAPDNGAELVRVVDRAVTRIKRMSGAIETALPARQENGPQKDALQRVQFEAVEAVQRAHQTAGAAFVRYARRQLGDVGHPAAIELAVNAYLCRVLRVGEGQEINGNSGFSIPKAQRHLGQDRPALLAKRTR